MVIGLAWLLADALGILLAVPSTAVVGTFALWAAGRLGAEEILLEVPVLRGLYRWLFNPTTYYRLDTALMFRAAVHGAVQACIDECTNERGIRALSELERKPIMKDFLTR